MKKPMPPVIRKKSRTPAAPPKKTKTIGPHHVGGKAEGEAAPKTGIDPDSIPTAYEDALKSRLKVDGARGFFLDGAPVSFDAVMLETNRVRRCKSLPPVGRKKEWLP